MHGHYVCSHNIDIGAFLVWRFGAQSPNLMYRQYFCIYGMSDRLCEWDWKLLMWAICTNNSGCEQQWTCTWFINKVYFYWAMCARVVRLQWQNGVRVKPLRRGNTFGKCCELQRYCTLIAVTDQVSSLFFCRLRHLFVDTNNALWGPYHELCWNYRVWLQNGGEGKATVLPWCEEHLLKDLLSLVSEQAVK